MIFIKAPTKGELSCKSITLPFSVKLQSWEKSKPVASNDIPATDLVNFEQDEHLHFLGPKKKLKIIFPIKWCIYSMWTSNSISTSVAPPKSALALPVFDVGSCIK